MKLERKGTPATISGAAGGPEKFKITASRIAFNILSSGLYSNKIAACIRELSCNAYDAHVVAGKKDTPFEIHLPTSFEPWFTVKDFGVGLSHEGMINLYTTYFASDKNNSNDLIGAMGLGSKSPFCYTEGFTVTSRFEGMTRIYSAFITEQGTPSVVLQTEENTPGVSNGLEVTFPVKESDCWEFENNAKNVLEAFNPRPVLNQKLEINSTKYVMKTDSWGMRAEADTHQGDGVRALQGMVYYSIGKIDISKMGPELQRLTEMPLDLFFPIGELQVAASREALQLDPVTVANITKALENVYHGLVAEVKKKIDTCNNAWEARLLIFSLINAPGTGKIINEALNKGELLGSYKNFTLADKKPAVNELDYLHTQIYRFTKNWRSSKYGTKSSVFTRNTSESRTLASMELANGTKKKKDFDREFEVESQVAFIINDLKFGGEKYIHFFLQEATDNQKVTDNDGNVTYEPKTIVYLFSRATKLQTTVQVMKEATAMVAKLGNPPVMLMSDMKAKYGPFCDIKAPVKPNVPKERRNIMELNLAAEGRKRSQSYYGTCDVAWCNIWKRSDSQPTGVKYYLLVDENKVRNVGFNRAKDLLTFVNNVVTSEAFGLTPNTPVYGLKKNSPLLKLTGEWVELLNHVYTNIAKVMTRSKELELSLKLKPFSVRDWENEVNAIAADRTFSPTSPMKKFADSLAQAQKRGNSPQSKALVEVLDEAKSHINPATQKPWYSDQFTVNFQNAWNDVVAMYPMLSFTCCSYRLERRGGALKIFREYVLTVDKFNVEKEVAASAASNGN